MKRKKWIAAGIALCALVLAGIGFWRYWYCPVYRVQTSTVVRDAVLYPGSGKNLQYKGVYQGSAAFAVITDKTGNEIENLAQLQTILGTADAPEPVFAARSGVRTLGKAVTVDLETDLFGNICSLTITDISERPVIGIAWKTATVGEELAGIAEVLERNGGFAVYLPMVLDETMAISVLNDVDGVLFPGGEDWNPGTYGEAASAHGAREWNDLRDLSDLALMSAALAENVPMIAICRGMQGMNIALGGGLIQDIPTYLGQQVAAGEVSSDRVTAVLSGGLGGAGYGEPCGCGQTHLRVQLDSIDHSKEAAHHSLIDGVFPDSQWLFGIFGSDSLESVATAHHQAVDPERLGQGLTVAAVSSDGIIEAVEYPQNLFALGLQWHPEKDALIAPRREKIDHDSGNLPLRALILAAGKG